MTSQPETEFGRLVAHSSAAVDADAGRRIVRDDWYFWIMCLIWGMTWIPIKIGVQNMSPAMFAALRSSAAGAILLGIACVRGTRTLPALGDLPAIAAAAVLANTITYALLFWGIRHTDTGLSAVVNLSLTPVALLAIAVLVREEAISAPKMLAMLLGAGGLVLLFFEKLRLDVPPAEVYGVCAVALAALTFAGGTVVARRLTAVYSATVMSGWILLLGGLVLGAAATASGIRPLDELSKLTRTPVLGSWLYLVLFGSVIGHTIFLKLSCAWTPSLAGLYAFVSPAIAVAAGVVLMDERLSVTSAAGVALLLLTTVLALRR
jgi:drug/metabolite transporter (DMT)-like permease